MPQQTSPCKIILCWMSAGRPKATCWCHPGATGWRINKARLAPKRCTAPSTCLRETMIYFYCRQRPSRPHIKHLNSSPLCSHMQLSGEAEPESTAFGGAVFSVVGALLTETEKRLAKTIGGKKRLNMQWPQSVQHNILSLTTQLHVVLRSENAT